MARAAVELGVAKFKVTGGEPLVRLGCVDFLRRLKALKGVEQVTLTTNGLLLEPLLPQLADMGLDGVNISLDAADRDSFARVTGSDRLDDVLRAIDACAASGIRTKLNCVLLKDCEERLVPLALFARDRPIDVRFIEVMPIGMGACSKGPDIETAMRVLRTRWPDLRPVEEKRGNGPARYYASGTLTGRIGVIAAMSRKFCADCSRVRLTSAGVLKPCLCYSAGTDLRTVIRKRPQKLTAALRQAIEQKPEAHCFDDAASVTEQKTMNQIGG